MQEADAQGLQYLRVPAEGMASQQQPSLVKQMRAQLLPSMGALILHFWIMVRAHGTPFFEYLLLFAIYWALLLVKFFISTDWAQIRSYSYCFGIANIAISVSGTVTLVTNLPPSIGMEIWLWTLLLLVDHFFVPVFVSIVVVLAFIVSACCCRAENAPVPAAPDLLQSLPIFPAQLRRAQDENHCPICREDYKADEELIHLQACKHEFHAACIRDWLSRNNTCPMCRARVQPAANNV